MGMESNGLTVADALALQDRNNYNDGMFGGNGAWVFFLFFLLAWGNGGLWGNNGNGNMNQINNDFLYTNLRSDLNHGFDQVNANIRQTDDQVRGVQQGLCDGFYAQNTTMLQGFNGIGRDLCQLGQGISQGMNDINANITQGRFENKECCCETNRNIDAVRYENARNTCDIINAGHADTQRIIDHLTNTEMQNLRDNLQAARFQLSQVNQNAELINELRPCSKPAYITDSPYQARSCNSGNGFNTFSDGIIIGSMLGRGWGGNGNNGYCNGYAYTNGTCCQG